MKTIFQTLFKSLLVGMVYVLASIIGSVIVRALGVNLPEARDAMTKLMWSFAGGTIVRLCLGPIAASIPATRTRHDLVWRSVVFLNLASVAIEGFFFLPEAVGDTLPGRLVQLFLASLTAGWIIAILFAPNSIAALATVPQRSVFSWIWRLPASTFTYVFFYFILGAANYALITKPYYEAHVGGLAVPAITVTLTAEVIRGVLITLSILPFLLTMRTASKRLAVQTGFILFAVGGLAPLTLQVGVLPLFLLAASAVEIFLQKFSTGVVISRLMSVGVTER